MRYAPLFWALAMGLAAGLALAQGLCWASGICTPHPTTLTEPV